MGHCAPEPMVIDRSSAGGQSEIGDPYGARNGLQIMPVSDSSGESGFQQPQHKLNVHSTDGVFGRHTLIPESESSG
jgi:hypothetical protein